MILKAYKVMNNIKTAARSTLNCIIYYSVLILITIHYSTSVSLNRIPDGLFIKLYYIQFIQ